MSTTPKALPDLSRTRAAIVAYDEFDNKAVFEGMDQDEVLAWFKKLEGLGEAVGIAFGLDTADRNSMDTCKRCVRPGQFVREAVARWEQRKAEGRE